jgi:hypothetical protein
VKGNDADRAARSVDFGVLRQTGEN